VNRLPFQRLRYDLYLQGVLFRVFRRYRNTGERSPQWERENGSRFSPTWSASAKR
jgi:hypothetical protein